MKTKVKVNGHYHTLKQGDIGYIDGYVSGADGSPCAVVVIPKRGIVDLIPTFMLIVTGIFGDELSREFNRISGIRSEKNELRR